MEMNIPLFTYFDIYGANNTIDYPSAKINMFQKDWTVTPQNPRVALTTRQRTKYLWILLCLGTHAA